MKYTKLILIPAALVAVSVGVGACGNSSPAPVAPLAQGQGASATPIDPNACSITNATDWSVPSYLRIQIGSTVLKDSVYPSIDTAAAEIKKMRDEGTCTMAAQSCSVTNATDWSVSGYLRIQLGLTLLEDSVYPSIDTAADEVRKLHDDGVCTVDAQKCSVVNATDWSVPGYLRIRIGSTIMKDSVYPSIDTASAEMKKLRDSGTCK